MGLGGFGEAGGYGVLMDITLAGKEVFVGADLVVGEASLPDGEA